MAESLGEYFHESWKHGDLVHPKQLYEVHEYVTNWLEVMLAITEVMYTTTPNSVHEIPSLSQNVTAIYNPTIKLSLKSKFAWICLCSIINYPRIGSLGHWARGHWFRGQFSPRLTGSPPCHLPGSALNASLLFTRAR